MSLFNLSNLPLNYTNIINDNGVIQDGLSSNRVYLAPLSDSGVVKFSGLSISSTTSINISSVKGIIVDNESNPLEPTRMLLNYSGQSNVTVTTLSGTNTLSYVMLTTGCTIQFLATTPTSAQRKSSLLLGTIAHQNGSITDIQGFVDYNLSPLSQFRDLTNNIGFINNGIFISSNGSNLNINLSQGILYGNSLNLEFDSTNPNSIVVNSASTASFAYRTQTGGTSSFNTSIDPTNYDFNGVITAITGLSSQATLQYVHYIPSSNSGIYIQRGQTIYSNLSNAVNAIGKESYITFPNLSDTGILIGWIAVTKGATTLNDSNQALFIKANKFGEKIPVNYNSFPSVTVDTFTTGFTYSNNNLTIQINQGQSNLNVLVNTMTGLTINGNITITGNTTSNSLSATTISSTTLTVSGVTFNKLLLEKYGSITGSTFSGNPKIASVTFVTNFPDKNYAITIGGEVERSWISTNKTVSGFTINAGANTAFNTANVYWIAKQYGEV